LQLLARCTLEPNCALANSRAAETVVGTFEAIGS